MSNVRDGAGFYRTPWLTVHVDGLGARTLCRHNKAEHGFATRPIRRL